MQIGVLLLTSLASASRVLVLPGDKVELGSLNKLQDYLKTNYGSVEIAEGKNSPKLIKNGEAAYDQILLLSSTTTCIEYDKELIDFIGLGGNFLWAFGEGEALSTKSKSLAKDLGRIIESQPKPVLDFFNNQAEDMRLVKGQVANSLILDSSAPIYYRGFSYRLEKSNPLLFPILTGSATASNTNGPNGRENVLISGLTGRNDARSLMIGSTEPFLDETFNRDLAHRLLSWTFRRSGVQRIDSITPKILQKDVEYFRIRDQIEVEVCLSQLDNSRWTPFLPSDAQIELTMMKPWIRSNLKPSSQTPGCLTTGPIQLPDRYGAYSLTFRYQRHGQSHLVAKEKLTVFPYKYDQTPRLAPVLWPYYFGWLSQLASSLLIVFPFLVWNRLSTSSKSKKA